MAPQLPSKDDFPSSLVLDIIPPPNNDPPTNILILLHGLGDTHTPFTSFGRALNLPETACLSIRGLAPMPFDINGYHWGDDIVFDQATGEMDVDTGFAKSTRVITDDVMDVLVKKGGYSKRAIVFFGFGQGGMAALSLADQSVEGFGGVVSIGAGVSGQGKAREVGKRRTPVLMCKGNARTGVKDEDEDVLKERFEFVEVVEWKRSGDGMPRSREEMLPIMRFLARRLRSVKGVPKGSVEIV